MEPIYVPLVRAADVADGDIVAAEMSGRALAVARSDGRYWVFGRECPHEGVDLVDGGVVDGGAVTCPNHAYVFDLATGECIVPGGCPPLSVLETEVRDETVCVKLHIAGGDHVADQHPPAATTFRYVPGRIDEGRVKQVTNLCRTDMMKAAIHCVRRGGENNLHSHPGRDEIFFILKGRARVYGIGDELVAELGPFDGVLIPRDFQYWYESVGDEMLELLQVAAADLRLQSPAGPLGGRENHEPRVDGRAEERTV
jgi:nitrite reductase/ring-hydroxylating ferredoxin subunit/mannose-6-phosphate isomerase-like protein (cupin superfamily)